VHIAVLIIVLSTGKTSPYASNIGKYAIPAFLLESTQCLGEFV